MEYVRSELFKIMHNILVNGQSRDLALSYIATALERNAKKSQIQVSIRYRQHLTSWYSIITQKALDEKQRNIFFENWENWETLSVSFLLLNTLLCVHAIQLLHLGWFN